MAFIDKDQFKNGKNVEAFLDEFFANRGWEIRIMSPHEERVLCLGDRYFTGLGKRVKVEYKSGIQTYYTGNVFLETVSVDTQAKPGWVYTCQADYLMYATLLNGKILVMRPANLRLRIEALKRSYPVVKTRHNQNDGYNTHGVIVPLAFAEKHLTEQIILLEDAA